MKIIRNSLIPLGETQLMTVYFLLFSKVNKISRKNMNHERIHERQHFELLSVSVIIIGSLSAFGFLSAWWILSSLLVPFVLYVASWLIQLAIPPYNSAYRDQCFEQEAYDNQRNLLYGSQWYRHLFGWVKYMWK